LQLPAEIPIGAGLTGTTHTRATSASIYLYRIAVLTCLLLASLTARTQDVPGSQVVPQNTPDPMAVSGDTTGVTLVDAVQKALTNYPTVRIALEKTLAARANVGLTQTQYLPQANVLWQTNRSTYNNIAGLLLPQSVVPSLSGTVLADSSGTSVWGSAGGLLMNWEPTRFGYRRAEVDAAKAGARAADENLTVTKLDVASAAAFAYLTVAGVHEQVKSAQADLARRHTFAETIHVLVQNQLRPGADASEADAEVAAAQTRLIQARTLERVDLSALAELLVEPADRLRLKSDVLFTMPAEDSLPSFIADGHPLALESNHLWEETKAQEHVWSRAYTPRFAFEASISGRGSGVKPDGRLLEGTNGLVPDRENWAVGVQATFAPFDYFSIREQKRIAASNERAQHLNYQNTLQALNTQADQARARLDGAIQIARNTPVQLEAARMGESQARARYQAGLANIVEATQAQALLEQAEAQDAIARIGVWQALLGVYAAQGDLTPFLTRLSNPVSGGH
jgi:outer membrane protein